MRVVLLGAPGSGKGTQAKILAKQYGMMLISIGDLLRAAVADASILGKQAKPYMESGQMVPDEVVLGLLREYLHVEKPESGFILTGFPRHIAQGEELDTILNDLSQPLHGVMHIDVGVDALIQRLTGRQTCRSCGQMYNLYTAPSKLFDRCDQCGGDLRQRTDDNEETIGNRLRVFEGITTPLFDYYDKQSKLRTIQGVGEINDIAAAIEKELKTLPSEESLQAELAELRKNDITFDDLERMVLESVQSALGKVNKEVIEPADKALKKAEKAVLKEAKSIKKKVTKAAKKEAKVLKKEAKSIKKKVTKVAKKEAKVLKKEAKAITKKVTKVAKKEAKAIKKTVKKAVKDIKKKVTKATAKKKPVAKKAATKKKVAKKKAVTKKKTTKKK
ncbi:MAG: adenylate kinase [Sulfuriflexus sp.]|nr:adenylate kinase [Sulfuriflexus sp.]